MSCVRGCVCVCVCMCVCLCLLSIDFDFVVLMWAWSERLGLLYMSWPETSDIRPDLFYYCGYRTVTLGAMLCASHGLCCQT